MFHDRRRRRVRSSESRTSSSPKTVSRIESEDLLTEERAPERRGARPKRPAQPVGAVEAAEPEVQKKSFFAKLFGWMGSPVPTRKRRPRARRRAASALR